MIVGKSVPEQREVSRRIISRKFTCFNYTLAITTWMNWPEQKQQNALCSPKKFKTKPTEPHNSDFLPCCISCLYQFRAWVEGSSQKPLSQCWKSETAASLSKLGTSAKWPKNASFLWKALTLSIMKHGLAPGEIPGWRLHGLLLTPLSEARPVAAKKQLGQHLATAIAKPRPPNTSKCFKIVRLPWGPLWRPREGSFCFESLARALWL